MFYKSKKFQYAAVSFLTSLVVSFIPLAVDMTPDQVGQMHNLASIVLVLGFTVIGGHQIMDMKSVDLLKPGAALEQLLDVVLEALDAPPQEVNIPEPLNEKPL